VTETQSAAFGGRREAPQRTETIRAKTIACISERFVFARIVSARTLAGSAGQPAE